MNTFFYSELDGNLEKTLRTIRSMLKKDKNNNIEEIKWINQEINGYKSRDKIPDYRLVNPRVDFKYTLDGYHEVLNTLSLNTVEKICLEVDKNNTKIIKDYFEKIKKHKFTEGISIIVDSFLEKEESFISFETEIIKNLLSSYYKKLNPTFQMIQLYLVFDKNQLNKTLINVKTKASEIFEDKIENTELNIYIKDTFMNKENTYNLHQTITNSLVNNGNNSNVSNNALNIDNSTNIKKNDEIYEIINLINSLDIDDNQKDFINDNLNNAIKEENTESKKNILNTVKNTITLFVKNSANLNTVNLIADKISSLISSY